MEETREARTAHASVQAPLPSLENALRAPLLAPPSAFRSAAFPFSLLPGAPWMLLGDIRAGIGVLAAGRRRWEERGGVAAVPAGGRNAGVHEG